MIRAIIFDFDGVILESAEIKTKAFRKLFESICPDKADAIVEYHLQNIGISRYVKFRHVYEHMLGLPLDEKSSNALGEHFSTLVFDEILCAPFVPGCVEFLSRYKDQFALFIASGTPQDELHQIISVRGIQHHFQEVHGSPRKKPDIIRDILERHSLLPHEAIVVGDGESDMQAARETGVSFIARLNSENRPQLEGCRWKLDDLRALHTVLHDVEYDQIASRGNTPS